MLEKLQNSFLNVVQKLQGKSHISESNIKESVEEVKEALLQADVHVRVVRRFVNKTIEQALGSQVLRTVNPGQLFIKILNDNLSSFLGDKNQEIELRGNPASIVICGLQGSGKTTTCAKLARSYKNEKKEVAMVSLDFSRAAAGEQLRQLGESVSVPVISTETVGASSNNMVEFAKKAQHYAKTQGYDVLIFDTAGRTELDEALLAELRDLNSTLQSCARVLVLDAITGQTAVQVAENFHKVMDLTGLIFSKLDSDARGGALLSVKTILNIPIHFIGSGESMEALEKFYPERMASRILGMGDVVSLVEKVQDNFEQKEADILQKKILKKTFTLQDYLEQMQQVEKMGSFEKIASMIPGVSAEQAQSIDVKQIKREQAILLSMTLRERQNPKILGFSRRGRVARGSGNTVSKVNALLKKFEKMKTLMKKSLKRQSTDPSMAQKTMGIL